VTVHGSLLAVHFLLAGDIHRNQLWKWTDPGNTHAHREPRQTAGGLVCSRTRFAANDIRFHNSVTHGEVTVHGSLLTGHFLLGRKFRPDIPMEVLRKLVAQA